MLIGFGCKLLCQRVSTEVVAGSTKLRQSKWYTAWGNEGIPTQNAFLLMGFVPLLTPSNLSHHCNLQKCSTTAMSKLDQILSKIFYCTLTRAYENASNNEPRGPFQEISAKLPGWNGFLAVENGQVPEGSIQLEVQTVATVENRSTIQWCESWSFHIFVLLSLLLGFLKISNCLEPGNWPKTKRLRAKDVIGSWNQGHSEDQNCPFSCDVSESQYLIIYPNHPFLGVVVLSSGAAFLYCF